MIYFFLYTLIAFFCEIVYAKESLTGWNYLNLHCRDNDNQPVDWWFMYKAPNENIPNYDFGRNFTFLTPDSEKRWSSSDKHITEGNLLFNTLSPLYRPTYSSYLGFAVYEDQTPLDKSTSAHGILMADEMGGVWITHTVPGLVDFDLDRPRFPVPEMPNGHLMVCVSLDLLTLNEIAMTLKRAEPGFTRVQVPARMRPLLPDWVDLQKPVARMRRAPSASIQFVTKSKLLYGSLMSRAPGKKHCLYRKFARQRKIVLDVYGNTNASVNPVCRNNFGVRQIEAISVKLPEAVHYVNRRSNDYARFAVSTAAHWQRTGAGKPQYWTCISNLPIADASGKGGMLLCMDDYDVWNSFDNFKVQEPTCNVVKKFDTNDVSVN